MEDTEERVRKVFIIKCGFKLVCFQWRH